jgi:predicted hotdog family 3-hydroxylacyl-ACP dehydratase
LKVDIAKLVPHAGSMCLLEEVLAWDENRITCRAISHRDAANPLRSDGRLAAIVGVEYAAQAVAVHGGLLGENSPRGGHLAAVRDIVCSAGRLDSERGDLVVSATRIAAESGRLLYDFRIEGGRRELVRGRLSVVLVNDQSPGHGG